MTRRPVDPTSVPLEAYCQRFDDDFRTVNQRNAFRRYLEGLLLPSERTKTLTALANVEPLVGIQRPQVQRLQWFVSESSWSPEVVNARRLAVLQADPVTAPDPDGVLVIDEHGDRKWGSKTAHVGRQYLANLGKVDLGVVSVSSLWADERVYWPVDVVPYTPAQHFPQGRTDPAFHTKLQLAEHLVHQAQARGLPFRAVVADCLYGEDRRFTASLEQMSVGYVLALKSSHTWWHPAGAIGALWEAAEQSGWQGPAQPGPWVRVDRRFRDGHRATWWALEVVAGPYGPAKPRRAVVVTTDPATLPDLSTWYLRTNLPAPNAPATANHAQPTADLTEIVRLYGLRQWVEQSYKQVKQRLGWSQYQVRSDLAIRRHWALVCCAFSCCWSLAGAGRRADQPATVDDDPSPRPEHRSAGRGENPARTDLAPSAPTGARLADTLGLAPTLVARLVRGAATARTPSLARCTSSGSPPRLL